MTKTFFTADTHFGHRRVIPLCKRPFADEVEMREALIANWNAVVGIEDTVWHLGDFAYRAKPDDMEATFARLNGTKHLVAGNHDRWEDDGLGWASVIQMGEVVVEGQRIWLCHYPMLEWPLFFRGAWHLFGHVHGNRDGVGASLDVGVDCWDFRPVGIDDIRRRLRQRGRIE